MLWVMLFSFLVIPAKAGIHLYFYLYCLDPRLRGGDETEIRVMPEQVS